MSPPIIAVSIDTEEDDWGSFAFEGESTDNIQHLRELQELFDRWGARPTYLVNRAPLMDAASVQVLGELSERESVEIGAHCHPWNTPPFTGEGPERSMMNGLSIDENRAKIAEVARCLRSELDVHPATFRAGRWGFGPSVAAALVAEGIEIDCSVAPFIDWSAFGGPDYTDAPHLPYRFHPERPLTPASDGSMIQLPTTVGFLKGSQRASGRVRRHIERSWLARLKVIGALDTVGLLALRWLSPETSSGETMVRLVDAMAASGSGFLQITFHSCTLHPGATPFVQTDADRTRFLRDIDVVLEHCHRLGCAFTTLREAPGLLDLG